jgi:hypothetical protein
MSARRSREMRRKCAVSEPGEHDFHPLELEGIMLNRKTAKKLLRSGSPFKRAYGGALLRRMQAALDYGRSLKEEA